MFALTVQITLGRPSYVPIVALIAEFDSSHVTSVSINEVHRKIILFGLCRWFKQVHCLRLGGLGLLLWIAQGSEVMSQEKGLGSLATLGSLSWGTEKIECILCEIYGLQEIRALASVFFY